MLTHFLVSSLLHIRINAAANAVSIIITRPKIRRIKNKNQEKKDMWINK
jgi:negative regulator of genetic competence, sporulation and motility